MNQFKSLNNLFIVISILLATKTSISLATQVNIDSNQSKNTNFYANVSSRAMASSVENANSQADSNVDQKTSKNANAFSNANPPLDPNSSAHSKPSNNANIKSDTTLTVALEMANNSPFEKVEKNGQISGFHIELLENVAKTLRFKIEWKPLPWSRALYEVETGKIQAITYVTPTPAREKYLYFHPKNVLHSEKVCVIGRKNFKENKFDGSIRSLYGKKVGLPKDYAPSVEIEKAKSHFQLVTITGDVDRALAMLHSERFDYTFFIDFYFFEYMKSHPEFKNSIEIYLPCFRGENRFIAFSKAIADHEKQAKALADAMVNYKKTADYKLLLKKWEVPADE